MPADTSPDVPPNNRLPVIDLGGASPGPAEEARIAAAIGHAARHVGFFYVVNHGIPPDATPALFAAAAALFALPDAAKDAVAYRHSPHNRGYIGLGTEALDPALRPDAKEAFNLGVELPPDDPDLLAGTPFCGPNLWPALPGFRDTALRYFVACQGVARRLHRAFAIDLGLPADYFAPLIDRPINTLRLLRYPPHPGTFDGTRYGAAPHTDYGNLTLLAQDDAGGLEVQARDGTWIAAPPIADSLVCNIGDCLMRWSNDVYVSTPHRVVNRAGRERYAAAFFFEANPDALVTCLPTCAGPDRPARYAPVTCADYLRGRLDPTYNFEQGATTVRYA